MENSVEKNRGTRKVLELGDPHMEVGGEGETSVQNVAKSKREVDATLLICDPH